MSAPVCHVSVDQAVAQPNAPKLPNIPRATDLSSALAAIEAIRQILMTLTGQIVARPSPTPLTQVGAAGGGLRSIPKSNSNSQTDARWVEVSRTTEKKRITNPDDDSQFIDVVRINKLVMRDSVTGEQWVFRGNFGD